MDPETTYRLWREACDEFDFGAADEHEENLREWVRKGGFQPAWTDKDALEIMGSLWFSENKA